MEFNEKKNLIIKFIEERGFIVENDKDLIEAGVIDSMGIIDLVLFLEEKVGVHFDAAQMKAENFRSVDTIMALISNNET